MFNRKNLYLLLSLILIIIYPNYTYAINCANPGKDGVGGTLSGIINTYYPGVSSSVSSGSTSMSIGSSTGSTTQISVGDLLLVIQMQDADINSTNTSSYGSGVSGVNRGYTNINSAGLYEYILATNSVSLSGGTLNFLGSGAGNGLLNSYTNSNATSTKGQSRYQIVRVPQYSSASLSSSLNASNWNGTTGGILAFDVAGNLNLNSSIVNLDGKGFRGGGARQLSGGTGGANSDLRNLATNNFHSSKGEGIAGAPRYVYDGTSVVDTGFEGYPNGSFAMGAPANAGGGGNDGNPSANDQNSGGGGGSNGGQGGRGGNSWSSNLAVGGYGGVALPNTFDRVFLGGGGGSGTRNNSTGDQSSGGVGGGIVMIRTVSISGSATISVNGTTPPAPDNDGGGGGGAGGTVLFFSESTSLSGLTINANGGKGADAWLTQSATSFPGERHGPGGGGGGGKRILSSSVSGSVSSGANGITTTSNDPYGATSGDIGVTITSLTSGQISGVNTLTSCYPSLTVTKSTSTSTVTNSGSGTTASYTINVSNATDKGEATTVNISDTLPTGFTYASLGTITLSGGTTRLSTSNPTLGDTIPNFGVFTIPAGASISIPFTVNIAPSVGAGTYQNPATASYLNPARTTSSQTLNSSYNSASSTNEDVTVLASTGFDYGDAPNTYGTLDASTGAKHGNLGSSNLFLGTNATDSESNGLPSSSANGDDSSNTDDEDSVTTFPSLTTISTNYSLNVRVTNTSGSIANLRGWIDFNGNGVFDSSESSSTTVATGTTGGTATLSWSGLSGLVAGQSYIRLRFTTDNLANTEPTGIKSNGEVEDYPITIGNNSISGTVFIDTNRNGILDFGENGIQNVSVTIVSSSNVCTTVLTNASGQYSFGSLPNGTYTVLENGENSASCPPLARPVVNMGGTTALKTTVTINNSSVPNIDFGNIALSSLIPFAETCPVDGFISEQINNTKFNTVDLYTNQKDQVGPIASFEYNAMGFNTAHRFIYGIRINNTTGVSTELIKVSSNGYALSLGEVSGLPQGLYGSGDYNPFNDRFYVQANNTNTIYSINVDTRTVDTPRNITLSGTYSLVDFVFNPTPSTADNTHYIFATPQAPSSNIFKINTTTGNVATIAVAGLPNSTYIAGFADPENNIYVEDTQTNLYKITLDSTQTSGIVTQIINNNVALSRADGARCPFSRVGSNLRFEPNNTGNGSPGDILYYPHQIFSKIDGTINLTYTSNQGWVYTLFKDVNGNSLLDNGDLPLTNGDLGNVYNEPGHLAKIIVKVFIPSNAPQGTVDVANITATLTPTNAFIQPSSLSVSDVTTVSSNSHILQLLKSVDKATAKPGENITYTITYTNTGSTSLNSIKIEDMVPANTTFVSASFGSGSSGTITNPSVGGTGKITWDISGSLAPSGSGSVIFVVQIKP